MVIHHIDNDDGDPRNGDFEINIYMKMFPVAEYVNTG
jgi:hypothetical protein